MSILIWFIGVVTASEWNPNEGMLADQVLQPDGQGEWVTARRLAQELLKNSRNPTLGITRSGAVFWLGEGDCTQALLSTCENHWISMHLHMNMSNPPWRLESEGWWSLRIVTGDRG